MQSFSSNVRKPSDLRANWLDRHGLHETDSSLVVQPTFTELLLGLLDHLD